MIEIYFKNQKETVNEQVKMQNRFEFRFSVNDTSESDIKLKEQLDRIENSSGNKLQKTNIGVSKVIVDILKSDSTLLAHKTLSENKLGQYSGNIEVDAGKNRIIQVYAYYNNNLIAKGDTSGVEIFPGRSTPIGIELFFVGGIERNLVPPNRTYSGTTGRILKDSIQVKVTDINDNPVGKVKIDFDIIQGDALINGLSQNLSTRTNAAGFASIELLLGDKAGLIKILVEGKDRSDDPLIGSPDSILIYSEPAKVFSFSVNNFMGESIGNQTCGDTFSVRIIALDENNNVATSFIGTVEITSDGNLGTGEGQTAAFINGVLSSHHVMIKNSGRFRIFASRTGGTEQGQSNIFDVTPDKADAAKTLVEAYPLDIEADGQSASTITVVPKDKFGNNLGINQTVILSTTSGILAGVVKDIGNGSYTQPLRSSTVADTAEVTAKVNGIEMNQRPIVVFSSGRVSSFLIESVTGGVIKDQIVGNQFQIRITALDVNGNLATSFSGTVEITSDGDLGLGKGQTEAFTKGVLLSHDVMIKNTGGFTIFATRTGGTEQGQSNIFDVTPDKADAAKTLVEAYPLDIVADGKSSSTITVIPRDKLEFKLGVNQIVTLSSTAGTLTGNVKDVGDGSYTQNLRASTVVDTAEVAAKVNNIEMNQKPVIVFRPGKEHSFLLESANGGVIENQIAGNRFQIRITALDANGNVATSFSGTVEITSDGDLGLGKGQTEAFTKGVLLSHDVMIKNTGGFTIFATRTGGTEQGQSNIFKVTAPLPFITGFFPSIGVYDDEIKIFGKNFNYPPIDIKFANVDAQNIKVTDNEITARIPQNSKTGQISISTQGGVSFSDSNFVVVRVDTIFQIGGDLGSIDISKVNNDIYILHQFYVEIYKYNENYHVKDIFISSLNEGSSLKLATIPNIGEMLFFTHQENNFPYISFLSADNFKMSFQIKGDQYSTFQNIVISSDGLAGYVTSSSDYVYEFSTLIDSTLTQLSDSVSDYFGLCLTKDNGLLYVTDESNGEILVIDAKNKRELGKISTTGKNLGKVTLSADENYLYTNSRGSSKVLIIDLFNNSIIREIITFGPPEGLAKSLDGRFIFVALSTQLGPGIIIIDTRLKRIITSLQLTRLFKDIAMNSIGTRVYIIDSNSLIVLALD